MILGGTRPAAHPTTAPTALPEVEEVTGQRRRPIDLLTLYTLAGSRRAMLEAFDRLEDAYVRADLTAVH